MTGIKIYRYPDAPEILKELAKKGIYIWCPGEIIKVLIEADITTA